MYHVWTVNGPEPAGLPAVAADYEHYLPRQLQPVAEGILPSLKIICYTTDQVISYFDA